MPPSSHRRTVRHSEQNELGSVIMGSVMLFAGALLLACALLDSATALDFALPAIWATNLPLWSFLGIMGILAGCYVLKQGSIAEIPERNHPEQSVFQRLILYTRPGCHLCEVAKEELREYENILPELLEIDISGDPRLEKLYGEIIPVIEIDGKVRFRTKVNPILLRRLIDGELAQPIAPPLHQLQMFAPELRK